MNSLGELFYFGRGFQDGHDMISKGFETPDVYIC